MKFHDFNDYRGSLEIWMEFVGNPTPSLFYSSENIVVSGMGTGLSYLFAGDGSNKVLDFVPTYFQLGVSGSGGLQVSSTYELGGELSLNEYGSNTSLFEELTQYANGYLKVERGFGKLNSKVKIVDDVTVEYQILIDRFTANSILRGNRKLPINEIGLFMKNPLGNEEDLPILIAYRSFDSILKSEHFSLIFKWAITKL